MKRNKPHFLTASLHRKWQNLLSPSLPECKNIKCMRQVIDDGGRQVAQYLNYRNLKDRKNTSINISLNCELEDNLKAYRFTIISCSTGGIYVNKYWFFRIHPLQVHQLCNNKLRNSRHQLRGRNINNSSNKLQQKSIK